MLRIDASNVLSESTYHGNIFGSVVHNKCVLDFQRRQVALKLKQKCYKITEKKNNSSKVNKTRETLAHL